MLTFGHLLDLAKVDRRAVRLLRHQDTRYPGCPSPYVLWRDHRDRFEAYQATQSFNDEAKLRAPIWASFVGLPRRETLFVGLYGAEPTGPLKEDRQHPLSGAIESAGSCNYYKLELQDELAEFAGRLWIEWGEGYRSWIQRGDGIEKRIVELRRDLSEPAFPGFSSLVVDLAEIEFLPKTWASALSATRGVYLLTCPKTREQYVGSASGADGFLGRWRDYAANGHGGNIRLIARETSNYQVSILETVGNSATEADILALESLWKRKLKSREMGLNGG